MWKKKPLRQRREAFKQAASKAKEKKAREVRTEPKKKQFEIDRTPEPGYDVPISSHLQKKWANLKKNWPHTTRFELIENNICSQGLSDSVQESVSYFQQNPICCSCHSEGKNCLQNEHCQCRQFAAYFQTAQKQPSIIGTNGPVPFDAKIDNRFFHEPIFNCGPQCDCHDNCDMNILSKIDYTCLEIKRLSEKKGFSVFAKKQIEKGQPISVFSGELVGGHHLRKKGKIDDQKYSLILLQNEKKLGPLFEKAFRHVNEEQAIICAKAVSQNKVYVNPLHRGNVARFINHECGNSTFLTRIMQNGLSPGNMKIVLFASETIPVGQEIVFDYGTNYTETHLPKCECIKCLKKKAKKEIKATVSAPLPKKLKQTDNVKKLNEKKKSETKGNPKVQKAARSSAKKTTVPKIQISESEETQEQVNEASSSEVQIVLRSGRRLVDNTVEPPAKVRRVRIANASANIDVETVDASPATLRRSSRLSKPKKQNEKIDDVKKTTPRRSARIPKASKVVPSVVETSEFSIGLGSLRLRK